MSYFLLQRNGLFEQWEIISVLREHACVQSVSFAPILANVAPALACSWKVLLPWLCKSVGVRVFVLKALSFAD